MTQMNLLRGVIDSAVSAGGIPMGTTPKGIEFAIKALHPAGEGSVVGVPDGGSRPTCTWSTTTNHQVTRSDVVGATSWDADVILFSHPLTLAYVRCITKAAGGTTTKSYNILNTALQDTFGGQIDPYAARVLQWVGLTERYRATSFSCTVTPNVSTLTNQGTIVAAQYPIETREMYSYPVAQAPPGRSYEDRGGECSDGKASKNAVPRVMKLDPGSTDVQRYKQAIVEVQCPPKPARNALSMTHANVIECWTSFFKEYGFLTQLPNTYVGSFREGAYAPFKLTSASTTWQNTRNVHGYMSYGSGQILDVYPLTNGYVTADIPADTEFPYPAVPQMSQVDVVGTPTGVPIFNRCDPNVIHIAFRGLHPEASFNLVIRSNWELEPVPGATVAAFVVPPPPPDPVALVAYALVARQLKDCYPEAYNSWEKLVDVIEKASEAANVVLPGSALVGKAARWLYDSIAGGRRKKQKGPTSQLNPAVQQANARKMTERALEQVTGRNADGAGTSRRARKRTRSKKRLPPPPPTRPAPKPPHRP